MSSRRFSRGLAAAAVTALAVTGVPGLASSASAATLAQQASGANDVYLYTPTDASTASVRQDGANTTVHLLANGGSNVDKIRFKYVNGALEGTIATVSRSNGAFSAEWSVPTALYNLPNTTITAEAIDVAGNVITSDDSLVTVSPTVDALDISNAPGSVRGFFAQPYDAPNDGRLAVVSGTTSDTSPTPSPINLSAPDGGASARPADNFGQTSAGQATRTWSGAVDVEGVDLAGAVDEFVVLAEQDSEDAEALTLREQTITTVTATAAQTNLPAGGTTTATVKVVDQFGEPIAGAEVGEDSNNDNTADGAFEYTNSKGEATFTGLTGTSAGKTYRYYVNTTGNPAYENGTDFVRTVTVASYTPEATTLAVDSGDGDAFDFDENTQGDVTITVKDQNGAPIAGQTVSYVWSYSAFDGEPANRTFAERVGTTNANGKVQVVMDKEESGTYTLRSYINRDGTPGQGAGDLSGPDLVVTAGQAKITYLESGPEQAAAGGTELVEGKLALEDGTTLGGRSVLAQYTRGDSSGGDGADAGIVQENGSVQLSRKVSTNADGVFAVTIKDFVPNPDPAPAEIEDGELSASTVAGTADDDNPGAGPATQVIEFLESQTPAQVTLVKGPQPEGAPGANGHVNYNGPVDNLWQPGELQYYTVTVSGDSDSQAAGVQPVALANTDVVLNTTKGYLTDGKPVPAPAEGGEVGTYTDFGSSKTYTTDGDGQVVIAISVGRDTGFDDDGEIITKVTATAGSVSSSPDSAQTGAQEWYSENPLNGGDLSIELDDDQSVTVLPQAPTTENVGFNVFATDSFGNLVGDEEVDLTDDLVGAFVNGDDNNGTAFSQFAGDAPALTLSSDVAGDQTVDGSWTTETFTYTDSAPATPGFQSSVVQGSEDVTATADTTISWYQIDFVNSTYTMTNDGDNPEPVGGTVIVTYTAVDQNGEPIEDLFVEFFRSGPDDNQDGSENGDDRTNSAGIARYVFSGDVAGTASIEAIARIGGELIPESRASTSVKFGTDAPPPPPPTGPQDITAKLVGDNNGAKDDKLKVNGPDAAAGATVKLFKIKKNGDRKLLATDTLNANGNRKFVVEDKNGKKVTKYVAKVLRNANVDGAVTNKRKIR